MVFPEAELRPNPGVGRDDPRPPQTIGLTKALPILLAGKTMPPSKAVKAGLVDEVVRPEALVAAARRMAAQPAFRALPGTMDRLFAAIRPDPPTQILQIPAQHFHVMATTFGNYPAPLKLLEVVEASKAHGSAVGLERRP